MILVSESFENRGSLTRWVYKKKIPKENIQEIIYTGGTFPYVLFWWKEGADNGL